MIVLFMYFTKMTSVKKVIHATADLLLYNCNLIEMAKVTPVFKAENQNIFTNNRTASSLCQVCTILVKLIHIHGR